LPFLRNDFLVSYHCPPSRLSSLLQNLPRMSVFRHPLLVGSFFFFFFFPSTMALLFILGLKYRPVRLATPLQDSLRGFVAGTNISGTVDFSYAFHSLSLPPPSFSPVVCFTSRTVANLTLLRPLGMPRSAESFPQSFFFPLYIQTFPIMSALRVLLPPYPYRPAHSSTVWNTGPPFSLYGLHFFPSTSFFSFLCIVSDLYPSFLFLPPQTPCPPQIGFFASFVIPTGEQSPPSFCICLPDTIQGPSPQAIGLAQTPIPFLLFQSPVRRRHLFLSL